MIIIHRCSCGHPDTFHQYPDSPSEGWCSATYCKTRQHELGEPELIPTFVDGVLNEFVHKPGSVLKDLTLCACEACMAFYETVRNDLEPLRPWYMREPA